MRASEVLLMGETVNKEVADTVKQCVRSRARGAKPGTARDIIMGQFSARPRSRGKAATPPRPLKLLHREFDPAAAAELERVCSQCGKTPSILLPDAVERC